MFKCRHGAAATLRCTIYRTEIAGCQSHGHHTNVFTPPQFHHVEIRDLGMHPNTSIGFSQLALQILCCFVIVVMQIRCLVFRCLLIGMTGIRSRANGCSL